MVPEIKKIFYATDLSENARFAFGYAADMARRYNAKITILHVMEDMLPSMENLVHDVVGEDRWKKLIAEKYEYVTEKIKTRIEDFCQEMGSVIESCPLLVDDIIIEKGNPTEEILHGAKKAEADMIVMGNRGYNILKDGLIGGTARRVVRQSKIPVLVIRLPDK
ncbi:universal stress protein [Desulfospira joergensenii]|uniref:universal stress protein n=1 Tax=Desulfospira joergensenii TaxID=53329 RepID=UPI0003B61681|nr:universal stress protein [Desulfospira joergensenii]